MPMGGLQPSARLIVLTGTSLLLAGWLVADVVAAPPAEAGSGPAAPGLQPEMLGAAPAAAGATTATAGDASAPATAQVGGAAGVPAIGSAAIGVDEAKTWQSGEFSVLLDRIFAPERTSSAAMARGNAQAGQAASPGTEAHGGAGGLAGPAPAATTHDVADPAAKARAASEGAYYRQFRALSPEELLRQADIVLSDGGEDYRTVAMLRALYDGDRAHALDYFTRAMATLPDRSRPEAVSVPAFAVGYLCKRLGDPGVQPLAERIAWTGYLNLSPELRQQAAAALLASASPADLERYAAYPSYPEMKAAIDRAQAP